MKKWLIPVIAVVVIAVAVGAFFGGRATAGGGTPTLEQAMARLQSATPQEMQQATQNAGRTGGGGPGFVFGGNGARANGGGAVAGTIVGADSSSITVKSENGSTKIVLVSGSTTIAKTQPGTMADLTTGQTVIVTGTSNSDGTVTATRVQVGATLPNISTQGSPDQGAAPGQGAAPNTSGTTTTQ